MSIRLANFKNKADERQKILDYQALLQATIDNEKIVAEARKAAQSGTPLPAAPEKSVSEQLADASAQSNEAFANLLKITTRKDAGQILYKLQDDNEINQFNRYFSLFSKDIAGQKNIDSVLFDLLWTKFKEKMTATGDTGISISPSLGEYKAELAAIEKGLIDVGTALGKIAPSNPMIDALIELCGLLTADLDVEFDKAFTSIKGNDIASEIKGALDTAKIDIPQPKTGTLRPTEIKFDGSGRFILKKLGGKNFTGVDSSNNQKIYLIIYNIFKKQSPYEIKWTGDPDTVLYPNTKTLAKDVLATMSLPIKTKGTGMMIGGRILTADYLDKVKPQKYILGEGLEIKMKPAKPTDSFVDNRLAIDKLKITGLPSEKVRHPEPNFGNYFLSLKALKKNYIQLYYLSGTPVSYFPKRLISTKLRKIINDILFEKSFEENAYQALDDDEKKLFDDLLSYAGADKHHVLALYKHKKYNDDQRDADIKRFNILRGQLAAGNDNPEILKELKILVFRLLDERVIGRKDFNKVIAQLVALS